MPRKFFPIYIIAGVGIGILLLTAYLTTHTVTVFNPQGIVASKERNLIVLAIILMFSVMIPLLFTAYFFAWKYREGNKNAKYEPDGDKGVRAWPLYWIIPGLVVLTLIAVVWTGAHDLDPYKPLNDPGVKPLTIQVVALNWKWLFIYPDQGIATVNFIEFPRNIPINFQITADAPMNSFWIPQLGGQIYAMPGMTTQLHLMSNSTGDFRGQNAEIDGQGYSGMIFTARAADPTDFNNWVTQVKKSPSSLTQEKYDALSAPSTNAPIKLYSSVDTNLFNNIIMKYMMPGMNM